MLSCACLLSSCIGGDEAELYDDTAITAVSLGTVKCVRDTIRYTYSAAKYPVRINNITDQIYNADSLVVGTDLSCVPMTFTVCNSGSMLLKNIDNDGFVAYASGDTINCTVPRTMRVVSYDGKHTRDYTISIVAHKEFADNFTWTEVAATNFPNDYISMKALSFKGKMYVLGYKGGVNYELVSSSDGKTWTSCALPTVAAGDTLTIATSDDKMYLCTKKNLYTSTDGEFSGAAKAVNDPVSLKSVLGAFDGKLYGVNSDDSVVVAKEDNGSYVWAVDSMQNTNAYGVKGDSLPARDVNMVVETLKTDSKSAIVTIIANKKVCWKEKGVNIADTTAVVWTNVLDKDMKSQWTYCATPWSNHYLVLPNMPHLSVTCYGNTIYAIGGDNPKKIYSSPDHGISWHTQTGITLPEGFSATNGAVIVADGNGFIYLMASGSGKVWKGRQNKQTWVPNKTYYE